MSNRAAVANCASPVQQRANALLDACNLVAIVGCFHRHLLALTVNLPEVATTILDACTSDPKKHCIRAGLGTVPLSSPLPWQ
ncbi:MAG: hypothetical protein JSS49_30845 [Planctomycetes bacterium]|nr:hypothetical protein [Planctomycetota bacterium]